MTIQVPSVGENKLLEFQLGVSVPGNQTLKLFVNNIVPGDADTAGSYTEMSTLGYAAKTLTKTSWSVSQVGGQAQGSYAQQIWTFTAGTLVTVYGYYIIDSTTGVLLYAEAFNSPQTVTNNGDQVKVTPLFNLAKLP